MLVRPRVYWAGVGLIGVVSVGWLLFVCVQQSWWTDDWVYIERTQRYGFWSYVFQNYNHHLMPGQFLWMWVQTKALPLAYWPVVVQVVLLAAAGVWAWGRAYLEIFGPSPLLWIPLAVTAASPVLLWPSVFWACATQVLPLNLLMALALWQAARASRGDPRGVRRALVCLVLALVLWEKAMVVVLPLAAVLLYRGRPGRDGRRLLVGAAAVSVVYLGLYAVFRLVSTSVPTLRMTPAPTGPWSERAMLVVTSALTALRDLVALVPLGGPWGTVPSRDMFEDHPPSALSLVALLALAGFLVATLLLRRRGWVPAGLVGGYLLVAMGLLVFSTKYAALGARALYEDRYFADVVPVLMLGLTMAVGRPRGEASAWRLRWRPAAGPTRIGAVALGAAVVASLVLGNLDQWQRLGPSSARPWSQHLRSSVAAAGPVAVLDSPSPDRVLIHAFWQRTATVREMTAALRPRVRWSSAGSPLHVVDGSGRLSAAVVGSSTAAPVGPQPHCGYLLHDGQPTTVSLRPALYDYVWGIQIEGFSGAGGRLVVTVGRRSTPVRLDPGVDVVQVRVVSALSEVSLQMPDARATACVTAVRAGPITAGRPVEGG